jgi:hypothetical protein
VYDTKYISRQLPEVFGRDTSLSDLYSGLVDGGRAAEAEALLARAAGRGAGAATLPRVGHAPGFEKYRWALAWHLLPLNTPWMYGRGQSRLAVPAAPLALGGLPPALAGVKPQAQTSRLNMASPFPARRPHRGARLHDRRMPACGPTKRPSPLLRPHPPLPPGALRPAQRPTKPATMRT